MTPNVLTTMKYKKSEWLVANNEKDKTGTSRVKKSDNRKKRVGGGGRNGEGPSRPLNDVKMRFH